MSKITPQDYIDAEKPLSRVGFLVLKENLKQLDEDLTIEKLAEKYGISVEVIQLVATTGDYSALETIVRLETERAEAVALSDAVDKAREEQEQNFYKPTPPKQVQGWHYAVAIFLLVAIGYTAYRFIDVLIGWIIGGF